MDWSLAAGLLLAEMDARKARKAAGCLERPAEITADGFVTVEGTAWLGSTRPDNGGADRPPHREDSAGLTGSTLPVSIEYGAARRRPGGGDCPRVHFPAALRLAANDDGRVHASTVWQLL